MDALLSAFVAIFVVIIAVALVAGVPFLLVAFFYYFDDLPEILYQSRLRQQQEGGWPTRFLRRLTKWAVRMKMAWNVQDPDKGE